MTQTPAERVAVFERILRPALAVLADRDNDPDAIHRARETLAAVTSLIDRFHGLSPRAYSGRSPESAGPHDARARAREAPPAAIGEAVRRRRNKERAEAGLGGIRKGRRQCEAANRDGSPCRAPAVHGESVCRRHGGAAPQVRIRGAITLLYEARHEAGQAFIAARGTPGEYEALCALSSADNAVKRAEAKVDEIRELRAELRRRKKLGGTGPTAPTDPAPY